MRSLAAEETEDAVILVRLTLEQWEMVVGNDFRAELLEGARFGALELGVGFLAEFDMRVITYGGET
jgi:hypothetical protein